MRTLQLFKKHLLVVFLAGGYSLCYGQNTTFDNMDGNVGYPKTITWSIGGDNTVNGYGHRFRNGNGSGYTFFYLDARQNATAAYFRPIMTFTTTGKVGIGYGHTDPGSDLLRVNGLSVFEQRLQIPSASGADNNSPGITVRGGADDFPYDGQYINQYGFGFHHYNDGNGVNGTNSYMSGFFGLDFFTNGASRLRINRNGNIGVGVIPNNAVKLDVKTGFSGAAFRGLSGATSHNVVFQLGRASNEFSLAVPGTAGHYSPDADPGDVVFRTEDINRNIIFNNGSTTGATMFLKNRRVGIATKTVDHTLQVGDGVSNSSIALRSPDSNGSDNYLAFEDPAGIGARWFRFTNNTLDNNFKLHSHEVDNIMVVNRVNGNIGIGTSLTVNNPNGYKLAVNGTIGAKEVKVENTSTTWPDYVFKKDYKLMPLNELETYLDQNSHLPDVPSASEVEKNGINLGEMDAALLKKVEELTLYMIEQEKRIKALEAQLAEKNDK